MSIAKAEIQRFEFIDANVRAFNDNGEHWFCAVDVCAALGYEDARKAIKQHCRERGVSKRLTLTSGGKQMLNYINEGNLYRLIARSRLPSAERFESWVFDDVLPTLRKTGEYKADWTKNRHEACASYKVMSEITRVARELIGKETANYHYSNEALLVNLALTGERKSVDRDGLDLDTLDVLAKLENRNSVLIARGVEYQMRKEMLKQYALDLRHPKLHLAA